MEKNKSPKVKPEIIAIIGKSASGKDTIFNEVLRQSQEPLHRIVCFTTRPPRNNEINGQDYIFLTSEELIEKFDADAKTIKPVTINNFKATNVSFVPDGQIGTIKSVRPMVFTDDPTQRYAWFDGGRTLITNRFEAKTKTMYVESEMAVLCVPNMPQYMQIYTVTV